MKASLGILVLMWASHAGMAQGMPLGEVLIVSTSALKKDTRPESVQTYVKDVAPVVKKKQSSLVLNTFIADRGNRKGDILLVCSFPDVTTRNKVGKGSPFTDKVLPASGKAERPSTFLTSPGSFTEYHLIGADQLKTLPAVGILGIHYIKVKKDKAATFEKFVTDKVHPKVSHLLPELQLLYYKAVDGDHKGSYITIFALKSEAARDGLWPGGTTETDVLKNAFKPLNELALELSTFFEDGSFLKPESGGAAAYFESMEWTDFVLR